MQNNFHAMSNGDSRTVTNISTVTVVLHGHNHGTVNVFLHHPPAVNTGLKWVLPMLRSLAAGVLMKLIVL